MRGKPVAKSVEEYLAAVPDDDKRAALEKLRKTIRAAVPGAVECISYGLPTFKLNGKLLVCLGAAEKHCAFYPGAVLHEFKKELAGYSTSKGTIRFQPDKPLPAPLVRRIVKWRIAHTIAR